MPRKIPLTDAAIATIEDMAGRGFVLDDIALMLDVSDSTLDRWLQDARVNRAYRRGRLVAGRDMADRLWAIAHQDQDLRAATTAAIFWLKSQQKWKEKHEDEVRTDDANEIVIYLPDNNRGDR